MSGVYEFGDRLKKILRLKDMRQKALARSMYLSEAAVSQYIHGERLPNVPMLISMAKALDVTTDQLLGLAPIDTAATPPAADKYEYHYDHTDCIWFHPGERSRCPSTCAQYRDGWNDAMNYIYRGGKGYRPYRRGHSYE